MLHVLALHPGAIITFVVLVCLIFVLSRVLNEPVFSVSKQNHDDVAHTSPWAGVHDGDLVSAQWDVTHPFNSISDH